MASRSAFGDEFVLTFLTDDPEQAGWAVAAGVQRIGPDFDTIGKVERQSGLATRVSGHDPCCLAALARKIGRKAELFARINPIHAGSAAEIEQCVVAGCQVLMLPYFHSVAEVEQFVDLVSGRARCVLLVETVAAAMLIDEVLALPGIDEVHIGLTDMMISARVDSRFRLLTGWFVAGLSKRVRAHGKRLALAGLARVDDPALPVPMSLVLPQYVRLGASGAFLTRVFVSAIQTEAAFQSEVGKLRQALNVCAAATGSALERARLELVGHLDAMVAAGRQLP